MPTATSSPEPILEGLRENARAIDGARILHVNATAYGGGVSELQALA